MIHDIRYCNRCCLPETVEGLQFDEFGICQACQSSEQKIHINWAERREKLGEILAEAREKAGNNYDCIIPISGGKDSIFQLHVLTKVYGAKPLAVTYSHNWFSETGWYNLVNALEEFEVDHMMFTPNRKLVNKLARKSVTAIGDSCWHCHAGIGFFPLQIAVKFNIPLLIWGESIAETSGRASHFNPVRQFDREYFTKVSAKLWPEEMVGGEVTAKDMDPFKSPTQEECERVGLHGIHLGDFYFWDDERQTEFVRDVYGWRETEMEGSYKCYKSAECIMPGVHDFTCYLKRGFGRSTAQASLDVRNGLMTRQEAMELIAKYDPERPQALDYYLEITGLSEEEFLSEMAQHKHQILRDKNIELPVNKKTFDNAEVVRPFVQEFIQRMRAKGPVKPNKLAHVPQVSPTGGEAVGVGGCGSHCGCG